MWLSDGELRVISIFDINIFKCVSIYKLLSSGGDIPVQFSSDIFKE